MATFRGLLFFFLNFQLSIRHLYLIKTKTNTSYLPTMFADGADACYTRKPLLTKTAAFLAGTRLSLLALRKVHHLTSPQPFEVAMVRAEPVSCSARRQFFSSGWTSLDASPSAGHFQTPSGTGGAQAAASASQQGLGLLVQHPHFVALKAIIRRCETHGLL